MSRSAFWGLRVFLAAAAVLAGNSAFTQDQPSTLNLGFPLSFNFTPPGARATALGAAFIGLADDATAAAANPAGLTILVEPEVSAHLRMSTVTLEQPGVFGDNQISEEGSTVPSFFSFVVPVKRAAISFFYQQESHFAANFVEPSTGRTDLGPFVDPAVQAAFPGSITFRYTETEDVLLDQFGVSVGVKMMPNLSVGGSVRFAHADYNVSLLNDFDHQAVAQRFRNYYSNRLTVNDSDRDVTFNAGVMFKPTDQFSIGGVYRQGGDFTFDATNTEQFIGGTEVANFPVSVAVPDSFGVGFAVRPTERLTLAFDVERIEYTDLASGSDTDLRDATEVHAGVEYVALMGGGSTPLSFRGGFYTDPDHDDFPDIDSGQVHGTFGVGVVLAQKFQIDFAFNLADRIREGLLSFVVRF